MTIQRIAIATVALLSGCATQPMQLTQGPLTTPPSIAVYWAMNAPRPPHPVDAYGLDCNDYARAAFSRLSRAGYHPRYVVAIIPNGEGHMVVELDGLAYDNLRKRPVPIETLGYQWVEASSDGLVWYSVGPSYTQRVQ